MTPPLIALEEHYFSPAAMSILDDKMVEQFKFIPGLREKLTDVDQIRLSEMEKGKVSMQIVSHACVAGAPPPQVCREGNDHLAYEIKKNPNRFAGFAVLPMSDPEECASELERTVRELKFRGAMIDNHVHGKYYDGHEYDIFWRKAEELDVPIYLHPTWPSDNMNPHYEGNFPDGARRSMGASGWGWHTETGLHVLRLFAAGVFDRCPKLKLIIGHFGEMLPFQLQRICNLSVRWGNNKRKLKEVWDENICKACLPINCLAHVDLLLKGSRRLESGVWILCGVSWAIPRSTISCIRWTTLSRRTRTVWHGLNSSRRAVCSPRSKWR